VTESSYYDWKLNLKSKPSPKRKKKVKDYGDLGISPDEFKRFVKLWRSKNIAF
jgi:hypothetical protein